MDRKLLFEELDGKGQSNLWDLHSEEYSRFVKMKKYANKRMRNLHLHISSRVNINERFLTPLGRMISERFFPRYESLFNRVNRDVERPILPYFSAINEASPIKRKSICMPVNSGMVLSLLVMQKDPKFPFEQFAGFDRSYFVVTDNAEYGLILATDPFPDYSGTLLELMCLQIDDREPLTELPSDEMRWVFRDPMKTTNLGQATFHLLNPESPVINTLMENGKEMVSTEIEAMKRELGF